MEERSFFYRYCIIFSNSFPKLFDFFEKALKENNFDTQFFIKVEKTFICISQTNEQRMLKEAENLKIKKPVEKELDKKNINYENKEYFIAEKYIQYFPSKEYVEFNESITKKTNKDANLIVEIIAPGKGIFEFDTPRREILSEGHKTILTFTGTKTLKKHKDFELGGGNMDSGSFRIDIYLDCDTIHLKENATITKKNLKGVVRYIYPLTDKSDLKKEMKEIEFNFSNNKKEKEQKNK